MLYSCATIESGSRIYKVSYTAIQIVDSLVVKALITFLSEGSISNPKLLGEFLILLAFPLTPLCSRYLTENNPGGQAPNIKIPCSLPSTVSISCKSCGKIWPGVSSLSDLKSVTLLNLSASPLYRFKE